MNEWVKRTSGKERTEREWKEREKRAKRVKVKERTKEPITSQIGRRTTIK